MNIQLKLLLVFCIGVSVGGRPQDSTNAKITLYDSHRGDSGYFSFNVETSDGFHHDASGYQKNFGAEDESLSVQGSYSYIGPDGVTYTIYYTADEKGFQPYGTHIPQFGTTPAPVTGGGVGGCTTATLRGTGLG